MMSLCKIVTKIVSHTNDLMIDPADGNQYIEELQNRLFDLLRPHQTIEDVEKGLKKLLNPDSELVNSALTFAHSKKSGTPRNNRIRHHSSENASFSVVLHVITQSRETLISLAMAKVRNLVVGVDEVTKFKMAIIEYIIEDVLELAEDFVRRHQGHFIISRLDIRTAMYADKDLFDLCRRDEKTSLIMENYPILDRVKCFGHNGTNQELSDLTYKEKVRYIVDSENFFIRGLKLIIKVFKAQLEKLPQIKPEVEIIFSNIEELLELSTLLLGTFEDALDSAGQNAVPYVGEEIFEIALTEFKAYSRFAFSRLDPERGWLKAYQSIILNDSTMISIRTAGQSFDLAVKHLLPNYLKNTIFQFFEYYKNFSDLYDLSKKHDKDSDRSALSETLSILFETKKEIELIIEAEAESDLQEIEPLDSKLAETTRAILEKRLDAELRHERNKPLPYMPPPEIYKFSEPDSKDNIQLETNSSNEIDEKPEIRCATLTKLVERLTYHKYQPNIVDTFLATYRSFLSDPEELLDLLIERFKIPEPLDQLAEVDKTVYKQYLRRFRQEYSKPVKMRVINVFKIWIKNHYHDFERNPALLEKLISFLDEANKTDHILESLIISIKKTIEQKKSSQRDEFKFMLSKEPPAIVWWAAKPNEYTKFDILTLHPVEFARQLTLFEFDLFRAIKPSEFINDCDLGSRARKGHKSESSPNLSRMTRHFTLLSYWIRKCIVEVDDLDKRAAIYNRAIEIMGVLRELNNFTGLLSIGSAIESAPISRLSHTKKTQTSTTVKIMDDYRELNDDHQKKLEQELKKCNPPCIPYLGSYQTKLIHAKEGNKTFIDEIDKTSPTLSNDDFHSSFSNSPATPASPKTTLSRTSHFFGSYYPNQQMPQNNSYNHSRISSVGDRISPSNNSFPTTPSSIMQPKMINFHKQRIRAKLLAEIANYQNPPYCLEVQPDIRRYIENIEYNIEKFVQNLDDNLQHQQQKVDKYQCSNVANNNNNNGSIGINIPTITKRLDDYLFEQSERIEPKNSTRPPRSKSKLPDCWRSPGIKVSNSATTK